MTTAEQPANPSPEAGASDTKFRNIVEGIEPRPLTVDFESEDGQQKMFAAGRLAEMVVSGEYDRQPPSPTITQEIIDYALEHADPAYQMASI